MEESFRVKKWVNFIPIARHYLTGLHTELSLNVKKIKIATVLLKTITFTNTIVLNIYNMNTYNQYFLKY